MFWAPVPPPDDATVPLPARPKPPAGRETTGRLVLATVILVVGLVVQNPLAYAVVVGLVLVTPLEKLMPRRRGQRVLRAGIATDLIHAVVSLAVFGLLTVVPMVLLDPILPEIGPVADGLASLPLVAQALIGLVVIDLAGYVSHRLQHEVPFLWRFHRVHHTSEELDWLAGARVHPLPGLLDGFFRAIPALLLGVSDDDAGWLSVIVAITALLTHANVSWRMPRLSRWWATPHFHHWHHADEPEAVNTNYAGLLPMWDRMFGTFHLPDRFPAGYGVEGSYSRGWFGQLADPFRRR